MPSMHKYSRIRYRLNASLAIIDQTSLRIPKYPLTKLAAHKMSCPLSKQQARNPKLKTSLINPSSALADIADILHGRRSNTVANFRQAVHVLNSHFAHGDLVDKGRERLWPIAHKVLPLKQHSRSADGAADMEELSGAVGVHGDVDGRVAARLVELAFDAVDDVVGLT